MENVRIGVVVDARFRERPQVGEAAILATITNNETALRSIRISQSKQKLSRTPVNGRS
jgi:hypothetical protein